MTEPVLPDRRPSPGRLGGFVLLVTGVAVGLAAFSAWPWTAHPPGAAMLKLAFKHVAAFAAEAGEELSDEELAKLPRHMRPQSRERVRTGTRRDTRVRVVLDDRVLLDRVYRPSGLRHDGPTYAYEELPVSVGPHRLAVTVRDTAEKAAGEAEDAAGDVTDDRAAGRWRIERRVVIEPGRVVLIELTDDAGLAVR